MAKEKLFKPEDFDKTKDKNFWQKNKKWIIGIATLLIVALIVICCIFCGKEEQKGHAIEKKQTEQVSENLDKTVAFTETRSLDTVTTQEIQEGANAGTETTQAPVAGTQESEEKLEFTSPKPGAKHTYVSDNVEQEAMNVIRGDYGNFPERREKLGRKYNEIQTRVNQLKREGAF